MCLIACNSTSCIKPCVYDYELYWFYGNHVCIFIVLFFSFFSVFYLYYYSVSAFCGE